VEKLSKSPLVLVLAQVKFAPVLQIKNYLPALQETLRHKNYPQFVEEHVQTYTLGERSDVQNSNRWYFGSPDRRSGLIVAQDSLTIETSAYEKFELFTSEFEEILQIVKDADCFSHTERVGLRYVNMITGNESRASSFYLQPSLRGLVVADIEGFSDMIGSAVSVATTPYGRLMIRAIHTNDGSFIPPELSATKLNLPKRPEPGRLISILDIDHNGEHSSQFDVNSLIARLSDLHDFSYKAFEAAVTSEAMEEWR
jgi:uncharacterized protein (TIGR04255 family)